MKYCQLSIDVRLWLVISLSACLGIVLIQPGFASEKLGAKENKSKSTDVGKRYISSPIIGLEKDSQILQLSEIKHPVTRSQMLVQFPNLNNPSSEKGIVVITGVKVNSTSKGMEVILETNHKDKLKVRSSSERNHFITDVAGGQLRLPSGEYFIFRSQEPMPGITEVIVTNINANTVRVTVVGKKVLPTVELFDNDAGLIFAIASTTMATQPSKTNR